MLDPTSVIKIINKSCAPFFNEGGSTFSLVLSAANSFKIQGNSSSSKAINNRNNDREEVTVIKWFDDYWVYVDITFIENQTFISLSVFQGEAGNKNKHQLFRAEWDDYDNDDEIHPQPHWHITANQVIEKAFEEFADDADIGGFVDLFREDKGNIVDINKMHFAMCGNWINDETHTHRLDDVEKIKKWFQGLLDHLRGQLEYVR